MKELNAALETLDHDPDTGAIVLTGSEKAFAAGADIKEMASLSFSDAYNTNFIANWSDLTHSIRTPIVSAVNGYALGGATFGQPEIKLGTIPGAGGSQRLTRVVGKARAMDLILTGRNFSGTEAGAWGVAAQVFDTPHACVDGAIATAAKIAGYSRVATKAAKEVVNKSQEVALREGVDYERRVFHGLFGTRDQKIGMSAFAEKKKPEWSHE
ncbi:MAG: hypothetical protein M1832_004154 [Thelocarpon impressellum]|nr:MAG: hypothetical protein M1832_004154 [Thelocarpon impressellum]